MASGRAPVGDREVRIRPLLPSDEVPSGRTQDWLTANDFKYSNKVHKVVMLQYDTLVISVKSWKGSTVKCKF